MRYIEFVEPVDPINDDMRPVLRRVSEEEIRQDYWPYWRDQVLKQKKFTPTFEKCLEDFRLIHYGVILEAEEI